MKFFALLFIAMFLTPSVQAKSISADTLTYGFIAKISDATRTKENWIKISPFASKFKFMRTFVQNDVKIELTPTELDADNVLFSYKVMLRINSAITPITSGDVLVKRGQKTHLLIGDNKFGNLVDITIKTDAIQKTTVKTSVSNPSPNNRI